MCETLLYPFVIRTWLPEEPLWKPCYLSQTHFVDTGGVCAHFVVQKKCAYKQNLVTRPFCKQNFVVKPRCNWSLVARPFCRESVGGKLFCT